MTPEERETERLAVATYDDIHDDLRAMGALVYVGDPIPEDSVLWLPVQRTDGPGEAA